MSDRMGFDNETGKSHVDHQLGVAGGMAKAFIHSPLSPLFLFACLAMGLMGLVLTPRQEDPQISVPMVDIFVQYPGASSNQVEKLVADPLERIMSEISGVKHVYSASMRGQAMVTVQFEVGEDMEESLVKLYDRLQSNMDKIPPGVPQPLVKPKAVDDVPIVGLTLWSDNLDDASLRILALDMLQQINEVPNSSQGFIIGGRSEQIRVEVYPERLAGHHLSLDQIAQTIRTANSEKGIGSMESGNLGFKVYTGSFLKSASDIKRLVVGTRHNVPVYIGDVARVFAGPEETKQMASYTTGQSKPEGVPAADAASAVTIAIAKKKGSNGVTVANNILAKVEELKGHMIPHNVHVAVTRNYGQTANEKVNDLLFKLLIATMAVTFLVWYSLGFRPALVTLIVIPVVILMTVFSAWLMNYTIDRVSLFALIFSIGILVDDAIVVVENIYRRWLLDGKSDSDVSVDAVREVGNPTILATFTVIAALLPMGFVSGMMGPYMEPIPALGSVAMIISLFAAFIFTPWLVQRMKPSLRSLEHHANKEHKQVEKMERFYYWLIPQFLDSKTKGYGFLASLFGLFFISCVLFYTTHVTVKILPLDNKPEFNVVINMPEGTALFKTANLAQRVTDKIRQTVPEVTALQTYVGTASPYNFNGLVRHYYLRQDAWMADVQVQLIHKSQRERTSHDIAVAVREILTPIAAAMGGKIQVVEMPPGPPVLQSVVAEVTGPTAEIRRQVALDMAEMFERSDSIVDVDTLIQDTYEIWRFEVNTEKAVRRGISVDAINRNLDMAMGGFKMGDIKRGSILEPTYIILQIPLEIRAHIASLSDLPITTSSGSTVPLGELGRFIKGSQDPVIYHKDLRPVEFVTGEVVGRLDAPIYGMFDVEDMLENYTTPDGVKISGEYLGPPDTYTKSGFEWTGEWTVTYETFRDMGIAFGVALILIYMLVVWMFGNFTLPAIIMAPIPLTLIGIIPGHWLMDAKFTATSMIGFIALAGIIVRNSILLVDFSQEEILNGSTVRDAVIQACKARTRPILITAFALVAGSSVILSDFIFQGMAISLLFGVLVSTLLTLLVIPLGCVSASWAFRKPEADSIVPTLEPEPLPHSDATPPATATPATEPAALERTVSEAVTTAPAVDEKAPEAKAEAPQKAEPKKAAAKKPAAKKPAAKKAVAKKAGATERAQEPAEEGAAAPAKAKTTRRRTPTVKKTVTKAAAAKADTASEEKPKTTRRRATTKSTPAKDDAAITAEAEESKTATKPQATRRRSTAAKKPAADTPAKATAKKTTTRKRTTARKQTAKEAEAVEIQAGEETVVMPEPVKPQEAGAEKSEKQTTTRGKRRGIRLKS
uniref:Putative Acriflavin resistance protein n=1 Tax=Magnetococcus massalia (strain MO-1) TaxID=451514 RepID=A0A1S7LMX2_MAGMO|nr:putative Acriflavin resistance protein [Candidatus Magnetococcus massalia]